MKKIDTIEETEKTVKIKVKLPHVNKKPLGESKFLIKQFSHSSLNLEQKNSRRKNTRFFAPLLVSA